MVSVLEYFFISAGGIMKRKNNLEETVKARVISLLEETLGKNLGVVVPKLEEDITDKLAQSQTAMYIPSGLSFNQAKKKFKEQFLKRELRAHFGNVSVVARALGVNRRSIHRAIQEYKLDVTRTKVLPNENVFKEEVDRSIRSTLDQYKDIFNPVKMEKLYGDVSSLSRDIAEVIPHQDISWREAEEDFEREFLGEALLRNNFNLSRTAKQLRLRAETVSRKMKKLGLRKE